MESGPDVGTQENEKPEEMAKAQQHPWFRELDTAHRKAAYFIFIGVNGTGKTTMMRNFIALNPRNLIMPSNMLDAQQSWGAFPRITPLHRHVSDTMRDPTGKKKRLVWFLPNVRQLKGTYLVNTGVFTETSYKKQFFESLCDISDQSTMYSNGGLFIDDTRGYIITKGTLPELVSNMLIARRHLMIDLFMAFHAFQDINGDLIKFGPRFFVFKTDLPPNDTVMDKIACKEDLLECIRYVNERAKKDPHYHEPFDPVNSEANAWTRQYYRK
jgi:hypothetical protein